MGTHEKCLSKVLLLSTHVFFGELEKIIPDLLQNIPLYFTSPLAIKANSNKILRGFPSNLPGFKLHFVKLFACWVSLHAFLSSVFFVFVF